jgi:hypothetical protein
MSGVPLKTGWVRLRLPQLPRENRNLDRCIDTDDSQDWWIERRIKKHLDEMHATHLRRIRIFYP